MQFVIHRVTVTVSCVGPLALGTDLFAPLTVIVLLPIQTSSSPPFSVTRSPMPIAPTSFVPLTVSVEPVSQ
jgi:hypothetical protein